MQVLLHITAGPATGRRFRLRQGQIARVGRTEWADFSVPADPDMADVHFEIQCDAYACWVRPLNAVETLRNGEPIAESKIRNGDSIGAGSTTFAVTLEGLSDQALQESDEEQQQALEDAQPSAQSVLTGVPLSDAAKTLLSDDIKAAAFLDALLADSLLDDAAKFVAAWLPRPESVRWGCACVAEAMDSQLTAAQRAAHAAAAAWAAEPNEDLRRAAQQAADAVGGKTPAGWLALAAFWSDGSIGPPDAPEVRAPEGIRAKMVGMAVVTAAGMAGPDRPRAMLLPQFISQGREMLDQKP